MGLKLKIVRGHNPNERMKSVDGLLNAFDKKLQARGPDEKLVQEVARLRVQFTALMEYLGLSFQVGRKTTVVRTKLVEDIIDALDTDNS